MRYINQPEGLVERIYWLIKLRWIAVIGLISVVLFASRILKLPIPALPVYVVSCALGVYNLIFLYLLSHIKKREPRDIYPIVNRIANLQISLDLAGLTALIHFSGGIENPFIFYFIFHMIIAGTLLSRRASFLQATFAVFLFLFMVLSEYLGVFTHYSLRGFLPYALHDNLLYIFGVSFAFISTLYIAVYMTTSVSGRLKDREKSLKQANELLLEKDRVKSEYVLRVSHNIKQHLAAIQNCIEPVTGGIVGPLNEKQANLLQRADKRTGKLLFFVKALLEITQIKLSGEIRMDYFSFTDMLSEAVAYISPRAKDKDISINLATEPGIDRIRAAREYIQETIANLLANSIKYTPRNGKIDINASDKGNSVLIEIKDTGIGIPEDEISKVFEEFYRASNAKGIERDGTGMGLAIAKQVVKRHNGKIWVESEQGKGSTFSIILPK